MGFMPKRRDVAKVLKKHNFNSVRFNGDHEIFRNDEGITFPLPKDKTIPKGTLKRISQITGIDMFKELGAGNKGKKKPQ